MRRILAIALHDLKLTLADRGAVMWMFLLPLVFATFFGMVMGGGGTSPADATASLTVVDNDGGVVARGLIADLEGAGLAIEELTAAERESSETVVRTLIIPEGFSAGVLSGAQQTLRLEKQPGTSEEAALVVQARALAAITRQLGRVVEAANGLEDGASVSQQAYSNVVPTEDLVQVESTFAGEVTFTPNGFAQSIPGMSVMFVMLVALTYGAAAVSGEREGGQLRRLVTAPVTRAEIVAGKIGGRFVVSALQITVFILVGVAGNRSFGVEIGDHPLQLFWVLLIFSLAVAPLGVVLGGWIRDPDRAANVGVMATMAMAAFGGCWWPIEVVSKPLKTASLLIPSGWAMRALHGLISFGRDLTDLGPEILALALFSAFFWLIATRSLRIE